jgi:hypothetical protein
MDWREGMQVLRDARLFAPAIIRYAGAFHVFTRTRWVSSGATIEAALDAGGFLSANNPPSTIFAVSDYNVILGEETIAITRSKTMARRIANALNEYVPGDRKV